MNHSEEIKAKLDVVDVIGEYINLKAVGSNFRALCPFHNEKTPSFMISPDKQIWHCFGCGKGGDLISFVMEMEGLDFIEAIKLLAPRAGVVLNNKDFSDNSQKNRLLQIMEFSRKYYHYILTSEKGDKETIKKIKEYLITRGLSDKSIKKWQIGYSLDNYEDLINFLKSKKFNDNEIFLAGISFKNEKGRYFNRFRDRIMFPINDVSGRTVAFTARINPLAKNDKGLGKYINSPQTDIYDKSKILFALDIAKNKIKEKDEIILVEGQMDAISAHEAEITNVCAVSGTALTISQLNLIKRYTKNIVLAFDQDSAGELATDRGVSEALKMGFNLKIAKLEDGKDPDEIIRKNPDNFKKSIIESKNIMDYYLTREFSNIDINDIDKKNKATNKVLVVINKLYNKIEQDFWIKELSQRSRVEEVFLREELQKIDKNDNKNSVTNKNDNSYKFFEQGILNSTWEDKLIENLLSLLLRFNNYCEYVFNNLPSDFILGKYKEFYNYLLIYYNRSKDIKYRDLLIFLEKEEKNDFLNYLKKISLIAEFYYSDDIDNNEKIKEEILKNILEVKKNFFKESVKIQKEGLILAEKSKDEVKIKEIMQNLKNLNDDLNKII